MITNVTAAVAVTALVAILVSIGTLLARASRWPDFTQPPKHAPHPDAYRPRPYDQVVLAEAYVKIPLPGPEEEPEPVPMPEPGPEDEPEPIDELDPLWDWRAYADALDEELVAA